MLSSVNSRRSRIICKMLKSKLSLFLILFRCFVVLHSLRIGLTAILKVNVFFTALSAHHFYFLLLTIIIIIIKLDIVRRRVTIIFAYKLFPFVPL